jgi:hypothetical protein
MVTFRSNNNNRRNNFRRNDRNFKPNGDRPKYGSNFSNSENFQRKVPGRNNHTASKLIEKYNDLARDALTSGDQILSENYFQHADHFTRVQNEQESNRITRVSTPTTPTVAGVKPVQTEAQVVKPVQIEEVKKEIPEPEVKKVAKTTEKKIVEKKSATN